MLIRRSVFSPPSAVWMRRELPGLLSVLLGAIAYFWLAPSHILGGDHGEFVALSQVPGIAHPPGYPLYVLYLRLMSWLPGEVARSSSLATAVLGVAQLALLYGAARAWKIPPLASGIAISVFAASPLALHLNTHAEVFALNGVLVAALLMLAGVACPFGTRQILFLNGLFFGLGFSHHHSIVFMLPLVFFTITSSIVGGRSGDRGCSARMAILLTSLAFAAGLLPNFLLIPWSSDSGALMTSWGDIRGLDGLTHHFLRRDYGTLLLAAGSAKVDLLGQQLLLFDSLWWTWSLLLPCAIFGISVPLVSQRPRSWTWWRWAALLACVIASGPLFVSRFNIPVQPAPGAALLERFHLMPALLLVLPAAYGLVVMSGYVQARLPRERSSSLHSSSNALEVIVGVVLVVFAFTFNAKLSETRFRDRNAPDVHLALVNGLSGIPAGSFVVLRGDHRVFGYGALQSAAGRRGDITFLVQPLWQYPWYRKRFVRETDGRFTELSRLIDPIIRSGRPVYLDQGVYRDTTSMERRRLPTYQQGLFRRVLRRGERPPSPRVLLRENERLFAGYSFPSSPLLRADGWPMMIRDGYAEAWGALAVDLERSGRDDLARIAVRHSVHYGSCLGDQCPSF